MLVKVQLRFEETHLADEAVRAPSEKLEGYCSEGFESLKGLSGFCFVELAQRIE